MVFNVKKIAESMKYRSPDLITRPIGRKIYAHVIKKMESVSPGEVIVLDCEGIMVMDSSFIDELIVRLVNDSMSSDSQFFIRLKNLSDSAEINIDSVFKSYSRYNSQKIVVITEDLCRNNNYYIGSVSGIEKDIIDYLRINRSAGIGEISKYAEKSPEEIYSVMISLVGLRIVRNLKEGIYSAV